MSQKIILSYDPGFGTTSLAASVREVSSLETAAARLTGDLGRAAIGMKTKTKTPIVEIGSDRFYVGRGAWDWGAANLISMDYTSLTNPARLSLLYANFAALFAPGDYAVSTFAVGLPVPLLQDATQAADVLRQLKEFKEQAHAFKIGREAYCFRTHRMVYYPQPAGSYSNWLIGEDLKVMNGRGQKEIVIVDIGRNTLDVYVLDAGQVNPRFVGGDKFGTRFLLEQIAADYPGRDLAEVDSLMRHGKITIPASIRRDWFSMIMGKLEAVLGNFRRFQIMRITGGGSLLLRQDFQTAIMARGLTPDFPANPVEDVVVGGWKWAARLK